MTVTVRAIGIAAVLSGATAVVASVVFPLSSPSVLLASCFALVFLLLFFVLYFRSEASGLRKRSVYLMLNSTIVTILFIFLVILLNLIVGQAYFRYDASMHKRYSLSDWSKMSVKDIDTRVVVDFFGAEGSPDYEGIEKLLKSYSYVNENIAYNMHDLDSEPAYARSMKVTQNNTVIVRLGSKALSSVGANEQTITKLLVRTARDKAVKVRFLQGHSEHGMGDNARTDYGKVIEALRSLGYTVEQINLITEQSVPEDTGLLIVAGPRAEIPEQQYQSIQNYLANGGKMLLLVNSYEQAAPLVMSFNIKMGQSQILDSKRVAGYDPTFPVVNDYPASPVTRDFTIDTAFPGVIPIKYTEQYMGDYFLEPMARTSPTSWLDANNNFIYDANEKSGGFVFAAILGQKNNPMKAVLIGDSDFASNAFISFGGNLDFFVNSVEWLTGEASVHGMVPREANLIPMYITDMQASLLRLLTVIVLPGAIALTGTVMWWRRRRL